MILAIIHDDDDDDGDAGYNIDTNEHGLPRGGVRPLRAAPGHGGHDRQGPV